MLDRFGKALDRLIRVAVLDPVADAAADMPLQHDLAAAVERRFGDIDLRQHILSGDILVHHAVDSLHLPDDLFQTAMQIFTSMHCFIVPPPSSQKTETVYRTAKKLSIISQTGR